MIQLGKRHVYAMLILVGIVAVILFPHVLSLDVAWSSDEALWLFRSRAFMLSVLDGDFSQTLQSHHPGVTTMWLGGMSLWTKYRYTLHNAHLFHRYPFWSLSNLARTRLTIAIVTGCTILIAFFLIQKLLGGQIAAISGILLAVDPIYLAQSRRLHTDALATDFLLLAILALLIFVENASRRRYLIFSGVCFGLACLSKSNALILVLWVPLLFAFSLRKSDWVIWLGRSLHAGLTWLSIVAVTFFICWPALWVYHLSIGGIPIPISGVIALCLVSIAIWSGAKLKHLTASADVAVARKATKSALVIGGIGLLATVFIVYKAVVPYVDRIGWALTTAHNVHHYFLGKIVYDPGWLFYPLMLSIKSAPLTLPLFIIGFVLLWRRREQPQYAKPYRIYIALSIFVLLFTICMSIGAKKFSRYLLPVFPILDILAAIGLALLIEKIAQLDILKQRRIGKVAGVTALGIALFIQVFPVLKLHPYYGTYYNPLWGIADITKVCTTGDASGLDLAADYLNQKPNPENLVVRVSPLSAEFFGYYFKGIFYRRDSAAGMRSPDYEVAYIRDVQINRVHLDDIKGTLEHVIRLNNVDYVWIYRLQGNEN